jgi:hypothetical protein
VFFEKGILEFYPTPPLPPLQWKGYMKTSITGYAGFAFTIRKERQLKRWNVKLGI